MQSFASSLLLALTLASAPCGARSLVMPDQSGTARAVPDQRAKATVLIFIAHDCPIANGYAPEVTRIAAAYAPRGVVFDLVYVEAGLSPRGVRAHEAAYGYHLPAIRDTAHALVKMTGVTVTPEAAVLSPDGHVLYRGRIDNKFPALGMQRTVVTRHDLCAALDAVLAGRHVLDPTTRAIGCFIPPLD